VAGQAEGAVALEQIQIEVLEGDVCLSAEVRPGAG
jgi:hypothetical protein